LERVGRLQTNKTRKTDDNAFYLHPYILRKEKRNMKDSLFEATGTYKITEVSTCKIVAACKGVSKKSLYVFL
jgi:hypothetical protein